MFLCTGDKSSIFSLLFSNTSDVSSRVLRLVITIVLSNALDEPFAHQSNYIISRLIFVFSFYKFRTTNIQVNELSLFRIVYYITITRSCISTFNRHSEQLSTVNSAEQSLRRFEYCVCIKT